MDPIRGSRVNGSLEMRNFFLYLSVLGGGGGLRKIAHAHGVSPGTISRYFAHTCMRVYTALKDEPDRLRWENDDERVGRGNPLLGYRAAYVRGASRHVYDNIRGAHHPAALNDHTHLGPVMFAHMYDIVKSEIAKAFDLGFEEEADGSNSGKPRKRLLGNEELFFIFERSRGWWWSS